MADYDRPYLALKVEQLAAIATENWSDPGVLEEVGRELTEYRTSAPSRALLIQVHKRLRELQIRPPSRKEGESPSARTTEEYSADRPTTGATPGQSLSMIAEEDAVRSDALFVLGQEVIVRGTTRQQGIVAGSPFWGQGEWHYDVFFGAGNRRTYRESDLLPREVSVEWTGLEGLLRNLALLKLHGRLSDNLYALYGSRTQFEVYQFRPAVKFLGNPDQRLLIADEVGLGKTIEAGIIYLELQARLSLERVLVVCPSSLREKWRDEMKLRFDEEFIIYDSPGMRRFLQQYEEYGANARTRGIVSLELLRRPEFADRFLELGLHLDLVIIDEAHHCRNSTTQSHRLATILSENADAMLLLTATPLQTGNEDLFNLFRILAPGEFDNFSAFLARLEPNEYVNRAAQILATGDHKSALETLRRVETTRERHRFTGNPYYREVVNTLEERFLSQEKLVAAQRRLVELNTLANIFTRTRKREMAENVPLREAYTLKVGFSPEEAAFYQKIIDYVRSEFARQHGTNFASGWVTVMRERQAASCISAALQRFGDLANSGDDPDEEGLLDPTILGESDGDVAPILRRIWYGQAASQGRNIGVDTKYQIFLEALKGLLAEDNHSKIIVFSFFRDTIEYLYRNLRAERIDVSYLHGGIAVADRAAVIDHFRESPDTRVLISSDVGSEGLDFQFCNTIFNYDLPWNPMKVEQRIGRVDRFGQKSPKVRVFNLVIENSIESRILERLYERIGLFQRAVGDIEAILGEEIRELYRQVYTARLSPHQEVALAEDAARNIIRRQQEMEEFEQKRLQFMGQEAIFSTLVEKTIEAGNFVSERELSALVQSFVREAFPRAHLDRNEPFDGTYSLDIDHELRNYLQTYVYRRLRTDQTAHAFLRHVEPAKILPVTFSDELASQRKLLHFVTLRHPLAQAAADYWREQARPEAEMALVDLRTDEVPAGDYYFYVFLLEAEGLERTTRLVPVAVVPAQGDVHVRLSERLLRLIQTTASPANGRPQLKPATLIEAEENARRYMTLRRDELEGEIRRSNDALINARIAAITQSYEARRLHVEATLEKVSEARIRRMHEGRLRNLKGDYEAKRERLEEQRHVSVSFSLVLRGCARITGE